ncbi:MAG: hypothetical protein PUC30_09825 [Lachnospiraceae bacterium]|nr:hypothetical protein [Lachnospiraceae bacterium]
MKENSETEREDRTEASETEKEDRPEVPETEKENIPEATPAPKQLYTATDTSGEIMLEVKPGFAATVTRREKYAAAMEAAKVMLPDLAAWSDGKLSVKTITTTSDGTREQSYTMNEKITIELLDEYFNLLEEYAMGKGKRKSYRDLQADATWQAFSYTGDEEITRNAVEDSTLGVCDLYFYTNLKKNILYFKFPADICFIDTGDRIGGRKAEPEEAEVYENKTQVTYEVTQTGLDSFKITGWNHVAGDYIKISLHPELYEKGDSFSLKDFSAQADAGTGKKNCPDCNGTGKERCTGCGGDGKNWDSLNGVYEKCYKCFGNGKMTCDKCRGTGDVNCNSCNGKGYNEKTCTFCFGIGKQ